MDSDIQILNPDLVIANLNGGADCKLYMELTITKGRGYVSAEKNKTEDTPIGVIAVDSIYTPVERVNLLIENTRGKGFKRALKSVHRSVRSCTAGGCHD